MKKAFIISLLIIIILSMLSCSDDTDTYNDNPKTYYVSTINGSMENDGLSIMSPLFSIEQVNKLSLNSGDSVLFERGSIFRGNLIPQSGSCEQRVTYASYGEGPIPVIMGSASMLSVIKNFDMLSENIFGIPCTKDIGNIIINDGEKFGVKKFGVHELINPLDFYFDRNTGVFFIFADEQMTKLIEGRDSTYYSVELCATQNIVELSSKHDITFRDLAIKNGGAHGFGGSDFHRITIENCRISYIGGGFLHYNDDNQPVRYGNGIELFNSGSYIEINGCEIFEIFDTGVTNQGTKNNAVQHNIIYKDNDIYNCGMAAYELWLRGKDTQMYDIFFKDNNVHHIGFGFSQTQGREDDFGLGYYIINFGTDANIHDIHIEENSFTNIYNANGYQALLLNIDIQNPFEENEIYKAINGNLVEGIKYEMIYSVDGEVYFLE